MLRRSGDRGADSISRGEVHRKFTGFLVEGAAQIAAGGKIVSGEKEVGEITSAASF